MKIGALSFHYSEAEVGGAQVPAVAFSEWMKEFGNSCDLISFTSSGKKPKSYVNPSQDILVFKEKDYFEVVNSYDLLFIATTGRMKEKDNFYKYFKDLKTPFITMIHGEKEQNKRIYYEIEDICNHTSCKIVLFTGKTSLNDWIDLRPRKKIFYPCTLPSYLLKNDSKFTKSKDGVVYAARLTTLKHPSKLAELSLDAEFCSLVSNKVDVYGATSYFIEHAIKASNWNRLPKFYNIYNIDDSKKMLSSYKYYWEVFGSSKYSKYDRRFNLSAVEAIGSGCIPIVNSEACPEWALPFSVTCNLRDYKKEDVKSSLRKISENYDYYLSIMNSTLLDSSYSYNGVKEQVQSILEEAV